jgi:acyl-CoA reductase-like NAD-dependent aldehyde dehydrogenase
VEPDGVPAARRLRVRGDAVQLHLDCRQPADCAGVDGQHGDLEAGVQRDAQRVLHPASARSGGSAAGCHQPRFGDAAQISSILLDSPHLAGVHFTGSTTVFNSMWTRIGANVGNYKSYPRLVGETGGKDFIIAHPSADPQELAVAMARGAFEYQGQKCSAASRAYVPQSLWSDVCDRVVAIMREMKVGDVADFRTFMGAVIDRKSFTKISGYLDDARKNAHIIQGGGAKDEVGFFIEPTLVETKDPGYRLMCEEILGRCSRHTRIRMRSGRRCSRPSIARRRTR